MDESQLLVVLVGMLDAGIAAYNANPLNTRVLPAGLIATRGLQPRQQGAPDVPAIVVNFSHKKQIGFPRRKTQYDAVSQQAINVQGQRHESTYHVEAFVPQSPADWQAMSEADVLNIARFIMQSDEAVAALAAQNIGVLRVTDIQSNYIVDDKEQNENVPFFELTFSHRLELSATAPIVSEFANVFNQV